MILKAEPLDPTFKWRGHKPERKPWRIIAFLLAIAVGAGFLVGRLSTAAPTSLQQQVAAEQQATSAGSVVQSQSAPQSETMTAPVRTTASTDPKPAAKDETKSTATASSKMPSATTTDKGAASPPVVLINPSAADKSVVGDTTKTAPKAEHEAPAKATAKSEAHKATDDGVPAATAPKRQAKSQVPAHANTDAAPGRQESVVVRRDDAVPTPRRDDAYVPPRVPESTLSEQRDRYDSVERGQDRPRFGQPYADRRYPEPDPRYAEDVPLRRGAYEDSRGYLRPFQGYRDFREYRRYGGGYEDDTYADRRPPVLRPMYGGGPNY